MIFLAYTAFILVVVLIFIAAILYFYWYFKKKTYTRERFAFIATAGSISILTLLIPLLFSGSNWVNLIIQVINKIFHWNIDPITTSWSDKILGLVFFLFYSRLVIRLHKNWDGEISERQHKEDSNRDQGSLLRDAIAVIKNREDLKIYHKESEEIKFEIEFPKSEDVAWNYKVAMYLQLISSQYKIDAKEDWHSEGSCYIAKYSAKKLPIGILVTFNEPSRSQISKFISYVDNLLQQELYKYFVFIKNGTKNLELINVDGKKVELRYENEILNTLVDFSDYKNFVIKSFEEKEIITGFEYTLQDIYTSPQCEVKKRFVDGKSENEIIEDTEKYFEEWVNNSSQKKHIALLGEYGQGKSVMALRLCYLIFKGVIATDRIPIIIELRGKYPRQFSDVIQFLGSWSINYRIDPNALYRLHLAGKLLLIFEGFDEMDLVGDYTIRLDHFRKIWDFSLPNSKIIITGRPNYFLNDNELKTILKTSDVFSNLPHCEELYINKFDSDRIRIALRNFDTETRSDIAELLEKKDVNKSFIDLISRPALLFLTCIVWKERNLSQFKNNINSATIIEEFIKQTYERQEGKNVKTPLSSNERSYFMLGVATGMVAKNGYTNQIELSELRKIIDKLYEIFPDDLTENYLSQNNATKKPLRQRFEEKYNKETVFSDIVSCGILVRDLSTYDSFKFAHKSFLEYLVSFFCANSIVDIKSNENDKLIVKTIKKALVTDADSIKKTPEVFKFLMQIIAKRINLNPHESQKESMIEVFNLVYPIRFLSFKIATFLSPFTGRDLRVFLIRCLIVFSLISFVGINKILASDISVGDLFKSSTFVIMFFMLILTFLVLPIVFENRILSRSFNSAIDSRYFPFSIKKSDHEVTDPANFNLWYQVCLEIGIDKEIIKKEIPKSLYHSLNKSYEYSLENIKL